MEEPHIITNPPIREPHSLRVTFGGGGGGIKSDFRQLLFVIGFSQFPIADLTENNKDIKKFTPYFCQYGR
jgi:hypothetical protein